MSQELETIEFKASPQLKRQLQEEADRLNLSLSAYIQFLFEQRISGNGAARLGRHVHEVFGDNGELMRRLAK